MEVVFKMAENLPSVSSPLKSIICAGYTYDVNMAKGPLLHYG